MWAHCIILFLCFWHYVKETFLSLPFPLFSIENILTKARNILTHSNFPNFSTDNLSFNFNASYESFSDRNACEAETLLRTFNGKSHLNEYELLLCIWVIWRFRTWHFRTFDGKSHLENYKLLYRILAIGTLADMRHFINYIVNGEIWKTGWQQRRRSIKRRAS